MPKNTVAKGRQNKTSDKVLNSSLAIVCIKRHNFWFVYLDGLLQEALRDVNVNNTWEDISRKRTINFAGFFQPKDEEAVFGQFGIRFNCPEMLSAFDPFGGLCPYDTTGSQLDQLQIFKNMGHEVRVTEVGTSTDVGGSRQ